MDRDLALIERLERLHPAVVSDCLDRLGVRTQVLEPHIRPLLADTKVAGYAATVHCVAVDVVPAVEVAGSATSPCRCEMSSLNTSGCASSVGARKLRRSGSAT